MRLRHGTSGAEQMRKAKREPLLEGPLKSPFSPGELETLCQTRRVLIPQGLTDAEISKALSTDIRRSSPSIKEKIRRMVQSGELPENPNKRTNLSPEAMAAIRKKRPRLIRQGLTDSEISSHLSQRLQRPAKSLDSKLRSMVKSGELPANPNKHEKRGFTRKELETIRRERQPLSEAGWSDYQIAVRLSKKISRKAAPLREKIRRLVASGELEENPNNPHKSTISPGGLALLALRRSKLAATGLNDIKISRVLAKELGLEADYVRYLIGSMEKSGGLAKNPNNPSRFSQADLARLSKLRKSLMGRGMNDTEISAAISRRLNRSAGAIHTKIHTMVNAGTLTPNTNGKKKWRLDEEDLAGISEYRKSRMGDGLTDGAISKELEPRLGRSAGTIHQRISSLVRSGKLPTNPNKMLRPHFNDAELSLLKRRRSELVSLGMGDRRASAVIAAELERSSTSINMKIHRMVDSGELPKNPNNPRGKPSEEGVLHQLLEAVNAYTSTD